MKRDTSQEMVDNAVEGLSAVMNYVFKMNFQHRWLIKPTKIRSKTPFNIREFYIHIRPSQYADFESRVEIGQGLIVGVVDVIRLHSGDIKDVRDGYIAVPETPGIGVELDEEAVAKYSYTPRDIGTALRADGSVAFR